MTNREKEILLYMNETGKSRTEAEKYFDIMEEALWSWEHPEIDDEIERDWRERNPIFLLRDDERL